ncbi:MAG: hypothetical protein ABL956_10275 [Hyphomonadaceae bacterium]
MRAYLAIVVGGCLTLAGALPAFAQDVDRIDRVTGAPSPGGVFRAPEGVRVVSPAALVFASFDRNFDGRITTEEMGAGAEGAFGIVDKNGDGVITGFEQTEWAALMTGGGDVLSNAMTFDIDLDRSVTRAEFAAGFKRLAGQIQPAGELTFADLVKPMTRPGEQANGDNGRGPPPGGRPPGRLSGQ